jgi:SSS family solute:Na+ symporter
MVAGLIIVPVVSLFTRVKDKEEIEKMFNCYEKEVTVRALTSLMDEEKK